MITSSIHASLIDLGGAAHAADLSQTKGIWWGRYTFSGVLRRPDWYSDEIEVSKPWDDFPNWAQKRVLETVQHVYELLDEDYWLVRQPTNRRPGQARNNGLHIYEPSQFSPDGEEWVNGKPTQPPTRNCREKAMHVRYWWASRGRGILPVPDPVAWLSDQFARDRIVQSRPVLSVVSFPLSSRFRRAA